MTFKIPTREEAKRITEVCEAFYCTETEVDGFKVELYDYRLASYKDFRDNNAFELRGICYIFNTTTNTWETNIALNKFFNLNQVTGEDIVRLYRGNITVATCVRNSEEYNSHMCKLIDTKVEVIGQELSWDFDYLNEKEIVRVQDKLDGSMISFVKFPNGIIRAKSKMSFESDQAKMAQKIYDENENIRNAIGQSFLNNVTLIWELVSPENQIVLEYDTTELVLLQARDSLTGKYLSKEDMGKYVTCFDLRKSEDLPLYTLDELVHFQNTVEGIEGYVVTFSDGQMCKIKTQHYNSRHGIFTQLREDSILKLTLDQEIDDVIASLSGYKKEFVEETSQKIINKFNHLVIEYKSLRAKYFLEFEEDRKKFAIKHNKDKMFPVVMKYLNTSFRDVEKYAEEGVKEYILWNYKTLSKVREFVNEI